VCIYSYSPQCLHNPKINKKKKYGKAKKCTDVENFIFLSVPSQWIPSFFLTMVQ